MAELPGPARPQVADRAVVAAIQLLEYGIVVALLGLAVVVLVRTFIGFFSHYGNFPENVVTAIDGVLLVIIVVDILHTVFHHIRSQVIPVRPFLVIGILAGVREILSASAHLTLSAHLSESDYHDTLVTLGLGVGVVVFLSLSLLVVRFAGPVDDDAEGS
jgi:uncharacterized membrane protein (DUF373 family)